MNNPLIADPFDPSAAILTALGYQGPIVWEYTARFADLGIARAFAATHFGWIRHLWVCDMPRFTTDTWKENDAESTSATL